MEKEHQTLSMQSIFLLLLFLLFLDSFWSWPLVIALVLAVSFRGFVAFQYYRKRRFKKLEETIFGEGPKGFLVPIGLMTILIFFSIIFVLDIIEIQKSKRMGALNACAPKKHQLALCEKQVNEHLTTLVQGDPEYRKSELNKLQFTIPEPSEAEGFLYYDHFIRLAVDKDLTEKTGVIEVLAKLDNAKHPSYRIFRASNQYKEGELKITPTLEEWNQALQDYRSNARDNTQIVPYLSQRRFEYFLFKLEEADLAFTKSASHLDLTSPVEFFDGAFSALSPADLLRLAGVLQEFDAQRGNLTAYLAYLAYGQILYLGSEFKTEAEQQISVLRSLDNFDEVLGYFASFHLPRNNNFRTLMLTGEECWKIYKQGEKEWSLKCAKIQRLPEALAYVKEKRAQEELRYRKRMEPIWRKEEERDRWNALPIEQKAEEIGNKIGQGIGGAVETVTESLPARTLKGFWRGLTE